MKKFLSLMSGGLAAGAVLMGVMFSQGAIAGVANTKHNLGSTGPGSNKFSGTAEVCVFCHTPHGSDTSAAVPLWNRTLAAPGSYTTYDSLGTSSLDGATAPVGSVSIACLSCHDGTQAMNVVLNAPGSGAAGDATWAAGTWTGSGQLNAVGLITNLGQDLRNDHPIGIQYAGGGITAPTKAGASTGSGKDPDFVAPVNDVAGGTRVWWVDTAGGTANAREKTDMLLYTRNDVGATYQPFVECASCHDPHVENVGNANPTFLRISNAGSAVCLACHVK